MHFALRKTKLSVQTFRLTTDCLHIARLSELSGSFVVIAAWLLPTIGYFCRDSFSDC